MSFKHICYDNTHSYNNLGIPRVIIYFTVYLCITKNKKFSTFCTNRIVVFNIFFLIKVFRKLFSSVPNGVAGMSFWRLY